MINVIRNESELHFDPRTFGWRNNRQKAKVVVEIQLFDLFLLHPPSLRRPIWTFRTIFQLVPSSKSSSRSRNDRSSFFFQMIEHNTDTIFDRFSKKSHNYAATNFQIYTSYLCQNPLTRSEPGPIWHTPPVTCRIRCPPLRTSRPPWKLRRSAPCDPPRTRLVSVSCPSPASLSLSAPKIEEAKGWKCGILKGRLIDNKYKSNINGEYTNEQRRMIPVISRSERIEDREFEWEEIQLI